jgi:beta-aspartyl-dipeptidase (metallo-type)
MLTLINNADVYAPESLGLCSLLLGGERILYCGPDAPQIDPSLLSETMDLQGGILVPGLIDAHVHATGGGGEGGFATQVPAVDLSQFTRHGVTSVVGLLGADDETRSTANLLARTFALREEGLSAWCWTGGYHLPLTTLTGSARRDIVYIDPVIGVGELAISDHRSSQPTLDELARVAADAHAAGMISGKAGIVHLHLGDGPRGLESIRRLIEETELPPAVFHPTHVNRQKALFDEACELSKAGMTIDLTAVEPAHEDEWSAEDAWSLYQERGCPAQRITVSSDSGGCIPAFNEQGRMTGMGVGSSASLPDFIRNLHRRGHALDAILPSLTSNVARLLKLNHKGAIAPGVDADLLCLDDDLHVRHVMARGRWMVRDARAIVTGTFE